MGTHFMQRDPKQWSAPESFIPQRFDPESPHFKRPDGGKRNTYAYSPFSGGQRVCLGKTFAEVTLKFVLPLYYHYFDFELVKPEHHKERPWVRMGTKASPEITTRFITRNKVPNPHGSEDEK